jgi:hypothetical protein
MKALFSYLENNQHLLKTCGECNAINYMLNDYCVNCSNDFFTDDVENCLEKIQSQYKEKGLTQEEVNNKQIEI